jgi:ABC-type glycerol-3-phosphate transport system substrate-binding protein
MIARFGIGRLAVAAIAWLVAAGVAAADTTVTFRFNDPEAPQMRQALDVFEQQSPGIKVDMQRVTWADAQQQYLREAAVGAAPDVAQLAQVWPRSFGAAGALRPLDDLIAKTNIGVAGWSSMSRATCSRVLTARPTPFRSRSIPSRWSTTRTC